MSRGDDLGGTAHRIAHLTFRALDGLAAPPLFPLSYLFWGCDTSLSQVRRGQLLCCSASRLGCSSSLPNCVDIVVAWCGMMSWSKVVMNHRGFILKMHSVRLSAFRAWVGGQVTSHLGSIMPDWHDLGYMPKVEVGELGGRPGYARNAGFFDMSSPASPPQPLPFAHLAKLPTSLSHFPSLLHLAA